MKQEGLIQSHGAYGAAIACNRPWNRFHVRWLGPVVLHKCYQVTTLTDIYTVGVPLTRIFRKPARIGRHQIRLLDHLYLATGAVFSEIGLAGERIPYVKNVIADGQQ